MKDLPLSSLRVSVIVALASIALAACGPDDNASTGASAQDTSQPAAAPSVLNASASNPSMPAPSAASSPLAGSFNAVNAQGDPQNSQNTQDNAAILSAQASLAADSQQVAPVMRYAPGDGGH